MERRSRRWPSWVRDDRLLVGEPAELAVAGDPDRGSREFKRRLGDTTPVFLGGSPFSADVLARAVLGHVLELVEEREDASPDTVVATHPANWGPYKLELFEQAVRQSTDGDVTLLSEPEAAARYYSSLERVEVGDVVAVYDLGGGTFDVAVLERTEDGYELLGEPSGVERLGGIDFDRALYRHVLDALEVNLDDTEEVDGFGSSAAFQRLRADCVRAKEALSSEVSATVPVLLPDIDTQVRVTRKELEELVRPALVPTLDALRRAIASAGLVAEDLHRVLLVGGSSRMPLIGEMLTASTGVPVGVDLHPKLATVLGAASLAAPSPADGALGAPRPIVAGEPSNEVHDLDEPHPAGAGHSGDVVVAPPGDERGRVEPSERSISAAVTDAAVGDAAVVESAPDDEEVPSVSGEAPSGVGEPTIELAPVVVEGGPPPGHDRPQPLVVEPAEPVDPTGRRRRLVLAVLGAVVLLGAVGALAVVLSGGGGESELTAEQFATAPLDDYLGLVESEALALADEAGVTASTEPVSAVGWDLGVVIEQDPGEGTESDEVALGISSDPDADIGIFDPVDWIGSFAGPSLQLTDGSGVTYADPLRYTGEFSWAFVIDLDEADRTGVLELGVVHAEQLARDTEPTVRFVIERLVEGGDARTRLEAYVDDELVEQAAEPAAWDPTRIVVAGHQPSGQTALFLDSAELQSFVSTGAVDTNEPTPADLLTTIPTFPGDARLFFAMAAGDSSSWTTVRWRRWARADVDVLAGVVVGPGATTTTAEDPTTSTTGATTSTTTTSSTSTTTTEPPGPPTMPSVVGLQLGAGRALLDQELAGTDITVLDYSESICSGSAPGTILSQFIAPGTPLSPPSVDWRVDYAADCQPAPAVVGLTWPEAEEVILDWMAGHAGLSYLRNTSQCTAGTSVVSQTPTAGTVTDSVSVTCA